MKNLLLITLILTACGTDEGDNSPANAEKQPLQSIALNSKKDLPDCNTENEKQLAYIRSEKEFYVCEENEWIAIEASRETIAGPKGEAGEDGEDGITVTTNNWYDAVTDKLWLIGALGTYPTAESTCVSPWRLPTKDEALDAAQRGLGVAAATIAGPTTMWTTDVWPLNATHNWSVQAIDTSPAIFQASRVDGTTTKGVLCVEQ